MLLCFVFQSPNNQAKQISALLEFKPVAETIQYIDLAFQDIPRHLIHCIFFPMDPS